MKQKIVNIQALRGVAAAMVLLPHLKNYDVRFGHGLLPGKWIWELGNSGVDLFFVISGFVMVTVALGKFARPGESLRFLSRRAVRIYPLYWVFSLLVLPIYLGHPEMVNSSDGGKRINLLFSFLLLPQQASPLIAQGWTLIYEFYFYLVFAIALLLAERLLPVVLVCWSAALVACRLALAPTSPAGSVATDPLALEFIAGCFIALALQRGWLRYCNWMLLLGIPLLIFGGWKIHDMKDAWERIACFGVPAALIIAGALAVEQNGLASPRWLVAIGDASYSLYLSQGLVLAALARIAWKKVPPSFPANALIVTLISAIAICVAMVCFRFVETPLVRLGRWLLDGSDKVPPVNGSDKSAQINTSDKRKVVETPV